MRGQQAGLVDQDDKAVLELHIVIRPDAQMATLLPDIRRLVAAYMESMTGIRLAAVNVFVDDIEWDEPPDDE